MKIFLIIVGVLAVFVAYVVIRQKRYDNRFVDRLRGQADTIILKNVRLVRESIGYHGYHSSTQQKCRELLVGSAFVILPGGTPAGLLKDAGYDVTYFEFDGPHWVTEEAARGPWSGWSTDVDSARCVAWCSDVTRPFDANCGMLKGRNDSAPACVQPMPSSLCFARHSGATDACRLDSLGYKGAEP
jgi:hypothetical protein